HTAWFISLPPDSPVLWRYIFKKTGAHLYNDSGDIFYSGSRVLTVHTKEGGPRTVQLKNGKTISLTLPPFSTTLLNTENGEVMMR
ncbi:MAG: hypothetical protein MUD08_19500, partial [Cytophagales bacterium]|nr:hypothetical protein [Cytophagales bacterium]